MTPENIVIILVAVLAGMMFSVFVGFVVWLIREFIKREIAIAKSSLKATADASFARRDADMRRFRTEVLAKISESKQNVGGEAVRPKSEEEKNKRPFWDDPEQIREAEAKLVASISGDTETEFSQLSAVEQWRVLDARKLELENVDIDPRLTPESV